MKSKMAELSIAGIQLQLKIRDGPFGEHTEVRNRAARHLDLELIRSPQPGDQLIDSGPGPIGGIAVKHAQGSPGDSGTMMLCKSIKRFNQYFRLRSDGLNRLKGNE